MELEDSLLADNLRKAPLPSVKVNYDVPTPTRRTVQPATPEAKPLHTAVKLGKASESKADKRNWWSRAVDVHIVEEGRVILKTFQRGNLGLIKVKATKPYGTNKGTGAGRLPSLVAGESIIMPDRHPSPDAYDGGLRERILADSRREYNLRKAKKTRSKGTRLVAGNSYRLPGKDATGKAF